jgi:hypothetical protein
MCAFCLIILHHVTLDTLIKIIRKNHSLSRLEQVPSTNDFYMCFNFGGLNPRKFELLDIQKVHIIFLKV